MPSGGFSTSEVAGPFDQYQASLALADEIERQGSLRAAEELRDCIHDHFSGTEICMCLAQRLGQFGNDPTQAANISSQAVRLHNELNALLS